MGQRPGQRGMQCSMFKFLRYPDLVERGIVSNRATLSRWIKHHGFPPGLLIGPNSRAWLEAEIDEWVVERARASTETEAT